MRSARAHNGSNHMVAARLLLLHLSTYPPRTSGAYGTRKPRSTDT